MSCPAHRLALAICLAPLTLSCQLFAKPQASSLRLSASTTSLVAGNSLRIRVEATPSDADLGGLLWTSTAPEVASVDSDGTVLGLDDGAATIGAKAKGGASASLDFTVARPAVAIMEIRESDRRLRVGDSLQLHVDCSPAYSRPASVGWTSASPSIASVDAATGLVTGLSIGSAIIAASDGVHQDQICITCLPVASPILDPIDQPTSYPLHSWSRSQLDEPAPTEPPDEVPEARILTERWIELYLPELPFDVTEVSDTAMYAISSADDPRYASPVRPHAVQWRYFPERAPFTPPAVAAAKGQSASDGQAGYIVVVYRVFLKMPLNKELRRGATYSVQVDPKAVAGLGSLAATYSGAASKEIIHANQEAYPAVGPKRAYLSAWLGQGGATIEGYIDFTDHPSFGATFRLIDESTGATAYAGTMERLANSPEEFHSGSQVYLLDFSGFAADGRYRIRVDGVGDSYPFSVGSSSFFGKVVYAAMRGMTHMRDGNHGLDAPEVTNRNRPPAHLDDAIEESTGQRVDLTGGHMDAGDREKIPLNMAYASAIMLTASRLFPENVEGLGDSALQMPESGNGIPDYLDELFYELDALYRMVANTHAGGAMTGNIRPPSGGYEMGVPPEGAADRIWFDGRFGYWKGATLAVAGALAMAANDPLVRKYSGAAYGGADRARLYLQAAELAWETFAVHENDAHFWYDDSQIVQGAMALGAHRWSSELLLAAANLFQATGELAYLDHIEAEWPAAPLQLIIYGAAPDGFPLPDYLSVALWDDSRIAAIADPVRRGKAQAYKDQAATWIPQVVDHLDGLPETYGRTCFGIQFQDAVANAVGWFFSANRTGWSNLVAWGFTGDAKYRDKVVDCWTYLLGGNPLSMSHITGLGDPATRVRWLVNEIWDWEWREYVATDGASGWAEAPPGLVEGDLQNGDYNWWFNSSWNGPRTTMMSPSIGGTPLFYRHVDGWVVLNEASSSSMAALAAIALPFAPSASR